MTENGSSLADMAVLSNGGFGGNMGMFWMLILFLFFGGAGGWGGYGGNPGYEIQNGFNNQALQAGIGNLNNTVLGGFANLTTNMNNGFNQLAMAGVQGFNGVQAGIADLKYVAATENCHDRQVISDGLRDVIAAQTANTNMLNNTIIGGIQAIKDDLCQQRLANKDAQISALQNQLNMANLAASQTAQTAYLIEKLTPTTTTAAGA